tara:strand:+ start:671 stop:895 length:225 start_codon:yes stop_codon:yes gene_type:complete
LPDINKKFYDIINQEDWDLESIEDIQDEPVILKQYIFIGDLPEDSYIIPTNIPGVWLNINLGFNTEGGDEHGSW